MTRRAPAVQRPVLPPLLPHLLLPHFNHHRHLQVGKEPVGLVTLRVHMRAVVAVARFGPLPKHPDHLLDAPALQELLVPLHKLQVLATVQARDTPEQAIAAVIAMMDQVALVQIQVQVQVKKDIGAYSEEESLGMAIRYSQTRVQWL
jgi:hypothetical protein